jgi:hypothetical protein
MSAMAGNSPEPKFLTELCSCALPLLVGLQLEGLERKLLHFVQQGMTLE